MRSVPRGAFAAIAIVILSVPAQGAGLKVFPVRILLAPDEPIQTMSIENSSDTPSRVQLRVYSWRQDRGEEILEDTRDVLANPGQFEIAPGATQIARFGLRTEAGAQEKSYRVILEEIPGLRAPRPGEVQTLLRISIPIFVPPARASGALAWRAWPSGEREIRFAVRNDGNMHVQINRLALTRRNQREVARQDMSVYLLPGSEKHISMALDAPVVPGEALALSAMTDQADKVAAELIAEKPPHEDAAP